MTFEEEERSPDEVIPPVHQRHDDRRLDGYYNGENLSDQNAPVVNYNINWENQNKNNYRNMFKQNLKKDYYINIFDIVNWLYKLK